MAGHLSEPGTDFILKMFCSLLTSNLLLTYQTLFLVLFFVTVHSATFFALRVSVGVEVCKLYMSEISGVQQPVHTVYVTHVV